MKKFLKLLVLNISIVVCAVVIYSDGLLGLRPTDPSFLRAGFSIICALALAGALIGGNLALLREPKTVARESLVGREQLESLLKSFTGSAYFGNYARTAISQMRRMDVSSKRVKSAIDEKFGAGSMTAERYRAVIQSAEETAENHNRELAMRMQMFDDAEYRRLKNFRKDDVSDEIQLQQIELYERNLKFIKDSVSVNEALILKLDTLTLEISDSAARQENDADELIGEITRLTSELQYYK